MGWGLPGCLSLWLAEFGLLFVIVYMVYVVRLRVGCDFVFGSCGRVVVICFGLGVYCWFSGVGGLFVLVSV